MFRIPLAMLMAAFFSAAVASADTLFIGESGKNPIPAPGVKVLDIAGDQLEYQTPGGTSLKKPLSDVQQISIDGATDFNAAEQAFATGDWARAASGYQSAMAGASQPWMKNRSAMRLAQAAGKIGRFDAAVAAYAQLMQTDPAMAAAVRPVVPADASTQLKPASDAVSAALGSTSLGDAQRGSLLGLQLQIERAGHDTAAVNTTLRQMMQIGKIAPADMAVVVLVSARTAIDGKDFAKAESDIDHNRAIFTDPAAQVDALYLLALSKQGQLSANAPANDVKDTAIDFMKVVTFGKDLPDQPHVADSLLHAAQLEERLNEPKVALQLYQQVSREYPSGPAAAEAKSSIDRLGKGP